MTSVVKTPQSLASDIGRMQRESGMVMATVTSLADYELGKPSKCEGWTRAHVIAHLARGADAMTNLATWAVTGQETPAYESREKRDAEIEAAPTVRRRTGRRPGAGQRAPAGGVPDAQGRGAGGDPADLVLRRDQRALAAGPPHHGADRPPRRPRHHLGVARGRPRRDPGRDRGLRAPAARSIPTAPACGSSPARARSGPSATARTGSRATTTSCCRSWRVSRWKKVCSTRASCRSCPRGEHRDQRL